MPWYVVTQYGEIEGRSTEMFSADHAMSFACDLIDAGVKVLRIEGPGVEIEGHVVEERCEWQRARRRKHRKP